MLQKAVGYPPVPLQAGMALALETYAGHKGGKDGVRLEEDIIVTEDGCEVLTRWPIDELMECWLPYR
jgi:Xaa-Pro aminopeptidase